MDKQGSEQGQATVEHLGIVALVALVMLGAGAISAVAAPGLFNRVSGGFQHALCVVTGQRCLRPEQEPCPVRRQTDRSSQGAQVGWLRMGHDRVLFIERRSDGSYLLSLAEGGRAGAGRGAPIGRFGDADASLMLGWKGGRQYRVATPAEARALVRRLRADPVPALSTEVAAALDVTGLRDADPSVDAYLLSGDSAADAVAKLGFGKLFEGGAEAGLGGEVGVKIAAHRKEVTTYAKLDAKVGVFYDAFTGVTVRGRAKGRTATQPAGGSGKPNLSKRPAPSTTPGARPERPGAEATSQTPTKPVERAVSGSVALKFGPGPTLLGAEIVVSTSTQSQQHELRARLDPSEPAVAAAIDRWRQHPGDADAMRALGVVAADYAALDRRTFATTDRKRSNALLAALEATGSAVSQLGLSATEERSIGLLEEQQSRPSGGLWETRLDCELAMAG